MEMAMGPSVGSRWHAFIERFLPWYDPARERARDARTERTIRRTEVARLRGERVIAEYRAAEKASGKADAAANRAGEAMVEEVRRADDQ